MEPRTDTINRRLRFQRRPTGKRIDLTRRDLEIFRLLNRYRYLRSTFIHAFVGGNKLRVIKRLGDLYHEGFLNRPRQQWETINARYQPAVYELAKKGEDALRRHGQWDNDTSTWLAKGRTGAHRQFAHSLMICDILASIELGVLGDKNLRFIGWREIIAKAPEATRTAQNPFAIKVPSITHTFKRTKKASTARNASIVPDGLFGLEYGKGKYRFFALEADRNTMPVIRNNLGQNSYLKKLLAYREIAARQIFKSHLGIPNLMVLTVTTNEKHMQSIMRLLDELSQGKGSQWFLFKTMPSLESFEKAPEPTPHMLTEPWLRVGHGDLDISSL